MKCLYGREVLRRGFCFRLRAPLGLHRKVGDTKGTSGSVFWWLKLSVGFADIEVYTRSIPKLCA